MSEKQDKIEAFIEYIKILLGDVKFLWALTLVLVGLSLFFFFIKKEDVYSSYFLQFAVLPAIAAIAVSTFETMANTTRETNKSISESAKEQIKKLGETTVILEKVAGSLKKIELDIEHKQSISPNLYIRFDGAPHNYISLSNKEPQKICLSLGNGGKVNATNPCWALMFPPEIRILKNKRFNVIKQGPLTKHPGYTSLSYKSSNIPVEKWTYEIEVQAESQVIFGEKKLFGYVSADNFPKKSNELTMNFTG